jgi:hypothetical protein
LVSSPGVGANPQSVIAVDVKGDGKLDLISANAGDNTLSVLTNNGNGIFGSNATLNVGSFPVCVTAADVNGDGKLDLISANLGANTLTVLTNNGNGNFGSNATLNVYVYLGPGCPVSVVAADVNGDGFDQRERQHLRRLRIPDGIDQQWEWRVRFQCHTECRQPPPRPCDGGCERGRQT